jgi:O-antigen/teichoic acid export membrane protein
MFGYTLSSILIGVGKPRLSGILMAGAATQYIFSLFVFVPIFGLDGAAFSLTLTGVTSLILIPISIRRHLKIDVFSGLPKVLFSGAVLAGILFFLPKSNFLILILGTIAGVVIYIILLNRLGYVGREDFRILKTVRPQS